MKVSHFKDSENNITQTKKERGNQDSVTYVVQLELQPAH